jgi:hypothetical protein
LREENVHQKIAGTRLTLDTRQGSTGAGEGGTPNRESARRRVLGWGAGLGRRLAVAQADCHDWRNRQTDGRTGGWSLRFRIYDRQTDRQTHGCSCRPRRPGPVLPQAPNPEPEKPHPARVSLQRVDAHPPPTGAMQHHPCYRKIGLGYLYGFRVGGLGLNPKP